MVDLNDPEVEIDENGNIVGSDAPAMRFDLVPVDAIEAAREEAAPSDEVNGEDDTDTDGDGDPNPESEPSGKT